MKVLIDMDGVVADWMAGAMKLHNKPYPYNDPANRGEHGWDVVKLWNMSPFDFWGAMEFDFWADLDPTPEADAIIKILTDEYGMASLCFLADRRLHGQCRELPERWRRGVPVPAALEPAARRGG